MSSKTYLVQPHDPTLFRDGRPFQAEPGAYAETLGWPLPSTLAGAVRTAVGRQRTEDWKEITDSLKKIPVAGPILLARENSRWVPYFHAPLDAVAFDEGKSVMRLRPMKMQSGTGCSRANSDVSFTACKLSPLSVTRDIKPYTKIAFWSLDNAVTWLKDPKSEMVPTKWLPKLEMDSRVHVAMSPQTQTGKDGELFSTRSLVINDVATHRSAALAIGCRTTDELLKVGNSEGITLGGERKISLVTPQDIWPKRTADFTFPSNGRLKLQLATPAIFTRGWLPGWIDSSSLYGSLPGLPDLTFKLVSAAVGRRAPVSGWDYETNTPKKARFCVPAGSVYFFEIVKGEITSNVIDKLWLSSVSDEEQDQRDGFGLILPGTWEPEEEDS